MRQALPSPASASVVRQQQASNFQFPASSTALAAARCAETAWTVGAMPGSAAKPSLRISIFAGPEGSSAFDAGGALAGEGAAAASTASAFTADAASIGATAWATTGAGGI
jgi:hypothetical protein